MLFSLWDPRTLNMFSLDHFPEIFSSPFGITPPWRSTPRWRLSARGSTHLLVLSLVHEPGRARPVRGLRQPEQARYEGFKSSRACLNLPKLSDHHLKGCVEKFGWPNTALRRKFISFSISYPPMSGRFIQRCLSIATVDRLIAAAVCFVAQSVVVQLLCLRGEPLALVFQQVRLVG